MANNQGRSERESKLLEQVSEKDIAALLQAIMQIESTNPPGNEIDLARWLDTYFRKYDLHPRLFEYEGKRANLIVAVEGEGTKPGLIFSAHMDTVPAGQVDWEFPPFGGEMHDGRIFGRGAADMKGGLTCMAAATTILATSGINLSGDLTLALTYDETYGLEGAKKLLDEGHLYKAGAILISEPSSLDVFIAEKGDFWLRCTARGRTAHTSMPHLGSNAILELAYFLIRLQTDLDLSFNHPLHGGGTYTVGRIQGGVTINVLPDQCIAEIDIRLCPGQDHEEILSRVRELAGKSIQVEVIDWKPLVETDPTAEIVNIYLDAVEEITGEGRSPKGVAYYTDGAILANQLSIPMVNIGPADTGMTHQPDENVEVKRLVQAVKIYLLIAARYLS